MRGGGRWVVVVRHGVPTMLYVRPAAWDAPATYQPEVSPASSPSSDAGFVITKSATRLRHVTCALAPFGAGICGRIGPQCTRVMLGSDSGPSYPAVAAYASLLGPTAAGLGRSVDQHHPNTSYCLCALPAVHACRWGVFRDRRPELYRPLVTLDGSHVHVAHAK